jgi:erythromycin esterase-like protein
MTKTNENNLLTYITQLYGNTADYDSLLEMSQNAEHVFIGESTHGTNEFYQIRADLTKRLILEGKFNAIAIEGDWPDTYRINRYVKGDKTITNAIDALNEFKRFPTWMWRNKVVVEFIEWLRQHNASLTLKDRIGFYGLDLYSLNASVKAVVQYLEKEDAQAAARAKKRYACFDNFKDQLQNYGYVTMFDMSKSCENVVIEQLLELNQNAYRYIKENSTTADDFFYIEQNARLIKNAEKYYRSIFGSNSYSWNMRDCHMAETLDNLAQHLSKKLQSPAKIVTWAHNSHLGDARATEVSKQGQLNIGQLAREKYGNKVILIGFLTYAGYVTAASSWDGIAERKHIRHALPGSYEYFFHNLSSSNFLINLRDNEQMKNLIPNKQLERAIGVIYSPATERISHYFHANLSSQFDAVIYIDKTTAIHPLETTATWHKGEIFETYPSGL